MLWCLSVVLCKTMSQDCCQYTHVRRTLIVFNFIFWFSGPAVLGLSIWFYLTLKVYSPIVEEAYYATPSFVLMVTGASSVFIGVFGCLAGVNENRHILAIFFTCVFIVFITEVYSTVKFFQFYDGIQPYVYRRLNETVFEMYSYNEEASKTMDHIQNELVCCGSTDYGDWQHSRYFDNVHLTKARIRGIVPLSCCLEGADVLCNYGIHHSIKQYAHAGCSTPLIQRIQVLLLYVGWGSFGFASLQLLGLALTCCMYRALSDVNR